MVPPSSFLITTVAERGRVPATVDGQVLSGTPASMFASVVFSPGMLDVDEQRLEVGCCRDTGDLATLGANQEAAQVGLGG